MTDKDQWLEWAIRLQSLAQNGLAYSKDVFDIQRFEEIRQIAAEMLVTPSGLPLEKVEELFCNESGYQTPKIDTGPLFSKMGKFCWFKKAMGAGLCQAAGVMSTSLSWTIPSRKSEKKQAWMSVLKRSLLSWTKLRIILLGLPTV